MSASDAVGLFEDVLQMCRDESLKPPYILCMLNPEGSVRTVRLHEDGSVEGLAKNDPAGPERFFTVGLLLDQSGQHRGFTLDPRERERERHAATN